MDFKTKPFAHQIECFERIKDKEYHALLLDPGLGKTKITIDLVSYRKSLNRNYTTLVVCPNTIIDNWLSEVQTHSFLKAAKLTGDKKRRIRVLNEDKADIFDNEYDIYVINYEATRIMTKELCDKKFDLVVFDESTCVKNPQSLQSKACFTISQSAKHRIILTGTPIMNNPLDIFAQYRCLNPLIFGTNFFRFRAKYAVMGGFDNRKVIKWINMTDFKTRVALCATRRTKDECLDLPEKLYQVVKVAMPEEQSRVYNNLKTQFVSDYQDNLVTAVNALTRLGRFSQITAGFTKDTEGKEHDFTTNPKVDWLVDFVTDLDTDYKVVVFCRYNHEIEYVKKRLLQAGIETIVMYGETSNRHEEITRFGNDVNARVFVTNPETGGIGINLISACYAVFLSNSYSYGKRVQAEDRIHRIGQSKNVTYIDVLMEGSVDTSIYKTLKNKESLSNMVIKDLVEMI